ncbi:MAG: DUF3604 domain-containing protein [Planctomycetota bacterium]
MALHELFSPFAWGKAVKLISASQRARGSSSCEIDPASVLFRVPAHWSLTYTAGDGGLPMGWALMVRCIEEIQTAHNLTVTSSWSGFTASVEVKLNIGKARVIWIEPDAIPLPVGETLTIELWDYAIVTTPARSPFAVYEVDPDGAEPEIGSELTFREVPYSGGECLVTTAGAFNVVLPTRVAVNERIHLKIAALDNRSQAVESYTGVVSLSSNAAFHDLPAAVTFAATDKGTKTIEVTPAVPGFIRVQAVDGDKSGESNPCVCTVDPVEEGIFWGDYHKHTFHCDGHLEPAENYAYARKFAFLDWCAISSHDMLPAPERGAHSWATLHAKTEAAHAPGEMVTFQAYEWSHNNPFSATDARGHKVILFLNPDHLLPLIPYTYKADPASEDCMPPTTLMQRLVERAGEDVIVIPHHLPLFKWWVFPEVDPLQMGGPLPEMQRGEVDALQPVAEVFSRVHGNYESFELMDWIKSPTTFGAPIRDTFWQDSLKQGVRTGAVCGGDNHSFPLGHPWGTGLTAVVTSDFSREGIFRAIQQRRTYGTSGPRVFISFTIRTGGRGTEALKIGAIAPFPQTYPILDVMMASPLPIDLVEVVRVSPGMAEVAHAHMANGELACIFQWEDPAPAPLTWVCYYLRVHMNDDTEGAWTSPIWFEGKLKKKKQKQI